MNNALAECLSATEHVSSHQYDKCRYSCFNCRDHVIVKTHLCLAWGNINAALILTNQFIRTRLFGCLPRQWAAAWLSLPLPSFSCRDRSRERGLGPATGEGICMLGPQVWKTEAKIESWTPLHAPGPSISWGRVPKPREMLRAGVVCNTEYRNSI